MTEGLFVLTTLFVAYVIYTIINEKKTAGKTTKSVAAATQNVQQTPVSEKPKTEAAPKPKPVAVKKAAPAPKPAAKPAEAVKAAVAPAAPKKTAAKTVVAKKTAVTPTPPPAEPETIKGTGLKDPKTGEVATAYSNYRFTKRWIKEALVAEKLLEKVYKNDELNANVEAQIKAGIVKLEGMKKYKP